MSTNTEMNIMFKLNDSKNKKRESIFLIIECQTYNFKPTMNNQKHEKYFYLFSKCVRI